MMNGFERDEYDGEEVITIKDIESLHTVIGMKIVSRDNSYVSGKEIRFLRKVLDLTQEELAERIKSEAQTVARWEKDNLTYRIVGGKD